jgi:hypothetical protein
MLFKEFHVEDIQEGYKTQTRRRISRFKKGPKKGKVVPPLKVGSVQPCKTAMLGESFALVKIFSRWAERLGDISVEDARAEGGHLQDGYTDGYSQEDYIKGVCEMYGSTIDENEVMWCYEFVLVKKCPTCGEFLKTHGQTWKCSTCDNEYGVVPLCVWYQVSKAEETEALS